MAEAYRRFIDKAVPLVRTLLPAIRGDTSPRVLPAQAANALRAPRRQPMMTARDVVGVASTSGLRWTPSSTSALCRLCSPQVNPLSNTVNFDCVHSGRHQ